MPFTAFALALTLAFTIALTIAFTLTTLRPHPHPHLTRTASPCPSIPPLQLVKLTEAGLCGASSKHFVHEKCKVDLLSGGGSSDGAKVEAEMEVEVEDVAKVEGPRGAMSKVRCPRCVSLREALHKGAGAPRAQAAAVPPISATQHRLLPNVPPPSLSPTRHQPYQPFLYTAPLFSTGPAYKNPFDEPKQEPKEEEPKAEPKAEVKPEAEVKAEADVPR